MSNGLKVITTNDDEEIEEINRIIFDELCKGVIKDSSKKYYVDIINEMVQDKGIQGIIFGCTEIEMLVKQSDLDIPILDILDSLLIIFDVEIANSDADGLFVFSVLNF